MVIGNGMIAKTFKSYADDANIIIFAKGVSNSQEILEEEFLREENNLKEILLLNKNKLIVYFSTCSIYDTDRIHTPYVEHKLKMEDLIKKSELSYLIFRLPQVVGNTKSPTLINFLHKKIIINQEFNIWKHSKRNLIDVDDVIKLVDYILKNFDYKNKIINIASNQNIDIISIVKKLENILNKKANYQIIDKGSDYNIDISEIEKFIDKCGIDFDNNYVDNLLLKYLKNVE